MKKIILLCSLMMLPLFASAQEETTTNAVERILINGATNPVTYYFFRQSGWGAPSCPNYRYAIIRGNDRGAKEMLELVTSAKEGGRTVLFRGNCEAAGTDQFNVHYMWSN